MAVLLLFFFWCIKDQCGFTFDQGDSLIISWKLRDKAFWSILVCSRFGKLCVRVAVFRSHKCYSTNIIFSNRTETSFDDGKARGWLIRLATWNENTILYGSCRLCESYKLCPISELYMILSETSFWAHWFQKLSPVLERILGRDRKKTKERGGIRWKKEGRSDA